MGAGLNTSTTKSIIHIVSNTGGLFICQLCDIAMDVVETEGVRATMALHNETADAADAVEGDGKVKAPDVFGGDGAVNAGQGEVGMGNVGMRGARENGGLLFLEEVPVIVAESAALDIIPSRFAEIVVPCKLAAGDASALGVVHVLDKGRVEIGDEGQDFDEAVLGVPCVAPCAVGSHIAVGVVGEGGGVAGGGVEGGVLVEFVGCVEIGDAVFGGGGAVADGVVGVGIGVGAHFGGNEFGADIISEEVGNSAVVDALGAAAEGVVGVGEGGDDVGEPGVGDEGLDVAEGFVFVGDGEAEVVGVAGEEGGVGQVGIGECGTVGDGDDGEAAIFVVAVADGVVGAEGDAGGATVGVVGADEGGAVGVAFFEEVGGGIDVGASAEDVGDGELAAEAVVGEGNVGGGVGVVDGHELAEGVG